MNRFLWLMRRELWEWRSIYYVPAGIGVLVSLSVVGLAIWSGHFAIDGFDAPRLAELDARLTPARLDVLVTLALLGIAINFTSALLVMRILYGAEALFGERRDRSILFWKSLPGSDLEAVLAKAATALIVMPLFALAAAFATQLVVMAVASLKLATLPGLGRYAAALWSPGAWGSELVLLGWVYLTSVLWYLPLVAACLLVSTAVPRSPLLVLILTPVGVWLVEQIVLRAHPVTRVILDRSFGLLAHAFHDGSNGMFGVNVDENHLDLPRSMLDTIDVTGFLSDPALWGGLVVGAALLGAAAWLRRYRDAAG